MSVLKTNSDRTAVWDNNSNSWDISDVPTYRWENNKNVPISDWFPELSLALDWIIKYDAK
jgi:hypothetical protein